jgi:hypothetical protein
MTYEDFRAGELQGWDARAVRRCGSTLQAAVMVSIVGAASRAGLPGTNARKGGLEF